MSDSKVFMVPDNISGTSSQVDPNLLLSMMGNNGGFGGNGNWMWIIFLFFLYGWNGNGLFGGNKTTDTVASTAERDMLLQAINGNASAISTLATTLNSDVNSVLTAINNVLSSIQSVGNQVGLSGQQVINAIQQGNMSIASQLSTCCCENKQLVTTMGYEGLLRDATNTAAITSRIDLLSNGVLTGFASTAYATQSQTNALQSSLQNQTQTIIDKISNLEANAQLDKINSLTAQLTAANSRAERQAELQPIIALLNAIKNALPSTVAVQYPLLTAVPNYVAYGYNNYGTNSFWS